MREDVQFRTRDGTQLKGWFYTPAEGSAPFPCIIMTHGLTGQIVHGLHAFAERFAQAGFAVLAYDHRGWGGSGGEPRQETNPFLQMQDGRDAITYVGLRPDVDSSRIGLWGTSYSGGVALTIAAADRRIRCVVALVPVVTGSGMLKRLVGEMNMDAHLRDLYAARDAEARGEGIQYRQATSYKETLAWFEKADPDKVWDNRITTVSHDMTFEFEPGDSIHRISPTPLLMIIADHDTRVCTDLQLEAYSRALEPKRLVMIQGGHYQPYIEKFSEAAEPATQWFLQHLAADET